MRKYFFGKAFAMITAFALCAAMQSCSTTEKINTSESELKACYDEMETIEYAGIVSYSQKRGINDTTNSAELYYFVYEYNIYLAMRIKCISDDICGTGMASRVAFDCDGEVLEIIPDQDTSYYDDPDVLDDIKISELAFGVSEKSEGTIAKIIASKNTSVKVYCENENCEFELSSFDKNDIKTVYYAYLYTKSLQ